MQYVLEMEIPFGHREEDSLSLLNNLIRNCKVSDQSCGRPATGHGEERDFFFSFFSFFLSTYKCTHHSSNIGNSKIICTLEVTFFS